MATNDGEVDAFLAQQWDAHATQPEAVAQRIARPLDPAPTRPEHLSALARLQTHVFGEHLGRFDEGRAALRALLSHPSADEVVRSAVRVGCATLDLAEDRPDAWAGLAPGEIVRAEGAAAAVCIGRGATARALALLGSARGRLAAQPDAGPGDHRPLAVACNNMTWALHERGAARSAAETAAMLELAASSREHWARAGTWLEVQRADYALALAHLDAGAAHAALAHARTCLDSCVAHDAPAHEHFFAHEALARVQRARPDCDAQATHVAAARAQFDRLDAADQAACRAALDALQ